MTDILQKIFESYKLVNENQNQYDGSKPIVIAPQYYKSLIKHYNGESMSQTLREQILRQFAVERMRQISIYGLQEDLNPVERLAILSEEVGEASKEANDIYFKLTKLNDEEFNEVEENLIMELTQVGAVCLSWLEHLHTERAKRK